MKAVKALVWLTAQLGLTGGAYVAAAFVACALVSTSTGMRPAHSLAANLRARDFDTALVADDAAVLHPLVLAAIALPILYWPENLGAKQPVLFRLERSIIDRFGLLDFAI